MSDVAVSLPEIRLIDNAAHPRPSDKRAAIAWAQNLMQRADWVVLDTETTGVGPTAEIIQIAILSPDNEVLLDSLVKPVYRKRMSAEASAKNHLTIKMLANAPTMPELMRQLRSLLKDKVIVCYNAEFDRRLLKQTIDKNGNGGILFAMHFDCAMLEYARFAGEWNSNRGEYRWLKLPAGDHSAIGDCRATLALIRQMASCVMPEPAQVLHSDKALVSQIPSGDDHYARQLLWVFVATVFVIWALLSWVRAVHW